MTSAITNLDSTNEPRSNRGVSPASVGLVLVSRLILFAVLQALVALLLAQTGHDSPWAASAAWWPITIIGANLISIGILGQLLEREGLRLIDWLRFDRTTLRTDLLLTLAVLVVGGILAMAPNLGLATLLWGRPDAPLGTFIQPLPSWAGMVAVVGFPVTIALSELPTYYGYVRPRLEALGLGAWQAVALTALLHGLQHAALPLVFDPRFLVWRAVMFLPFALFIGTALRWRPRLLPYLMVAHGLLDLTVGVMILQTSLG